MPTTPTRLPAKSTGVTESNIQYELFEGLTTYTADGQVAPGVAKSWDISDDGTTYTFHLREDDKWSNGDPVTAGDFVYSWQRLVDPATASDYAPIASVIRMVATGRRMKSALMLTRRSPRLPAHPARAGAALAPSGRAGGRRRAW